MAVRVLVTGGSGFLGSAIIEALQAKHPNWTLFNLDLRPSTRSGRNVHFETANITAPAEIEKVLAKVRPDVVVHTAGVIPNGQKRYSSSKADCDWVFSINYEGTKNVVNAARNNACGALVYTSSCTVVTDDVDHDFHLMNETIPLGNATLVYGSSKAAAENYVLAANTASFSTCALRPSTIIGPRDSYGVIATIHSCIANFETPWIIGDGDNLYDFVGISNVADAHVLAVENLLNKSHDNFSSTSTTNTLESAAGHAFFISNQEPIYFRDFMLAIWAQFGHVPPFQMRIPATLATFAGHAAEWGSWLTGREAALSRGSVKDAIGVRYSNNAKAVRILGYRPRIGFADVVKLACDDYKLDLERNRSVVNRV